MSRLSAYSRVGAYLRGALNRSITVSSSGRSMSAYLVGSMNFEGVFESCWLDECACVFMY